MMVTTTIANRYENIKLVAFPEYKEVDKRFAFLQLGDNDKTCICYDNNLYVKTLKEYLEEGMLDNQHIEDLNIDLAKIGIPICTSTYLQILAILDKAELLNLL